MADSLWDAGSHPVNVVQWWDPVTLNGEVHFTPSGKVDFPHSPPNCYIVEHHTIIYPNQSRQGEFPNLSPQRLSLFGFGAQRS